LNQLQLFVIGRNLAQIEANVKSMRVKDLLPSKSVRILPNNDRFFVQIARNGKDKICLPTLKILYTIQIKQRFIDACVTIL